MAELVLQGLTKVYPRKKQGLFSKAKTGAATVETTAVRNLDLVIEDGEFLVLLGESGCGKTTLLRMIAGLEEPTAGTIQMDGEDITDVYPEDREMAMVFQNYALYSHLSVRDNLAFPLRTQHLLPEEVTRRVEEIAALLELEPLLEKKPRELSGGEQQRAAIGRAIIRRPKLFLMDEPLSNLDVKLRGKLRAHIKRLHRALGITFVYVTHDQWEAMALADRIALMRDGKILETGTPQALYQNPRHLYTARFLGQPEMNLWENAVLRLDQNGWQVSAFGITLPLSETQAASLTPADQGRSVTIGLRPVHCAVSAQGPEAEIRMAEQVGGEWVLRLSLSGRSFTLVTEAGGATWLKGQRLRLAPDASHIHLFDPETGVRI